MKITRSLNLYSAALLTVMFAANPAHASYSWHDGGSFEPMSNTAESITGSISTPGFSGKELTLKFENGETATLKFTDWTMNKWAGEEADDVEAETFEVTKAPGKLLNGNTLCDSDPTYFVFYDQEDEIIGRTLNLLVYNSPTAPENLDSDGLCATFSYIVK